MRLCFACFFFLMIRRPPRSTLFPYTTLFRSLDALFAGERGARLPAVERVVCWFGARDPDFARRLAAISPGAIDRKSTRLNSSHSQISYAVFCLKKKNTKQEPTTPTSPYEAYM